MTIDYSFLLRKRSGLTPISADAVEVELSGSRSCSARTPVVLLLDGTRALLKPNGSTSSRRIRVKAQALMGSTLDIPVNAFYDNRLSPDIQQDTTIERIAIDAGKACSLEQVVAGGLEIQRAEDVVLLGDKTTGFATLSLKMPNPFAWNSLAPQVRGNAR